MVPGGVDDATLWEHLYRYRFALQFVRGKDVLDVACGDGYGTAAIGRAGARSVVGMDIDAAACDYARRRYGVDARPADAAHLPLGDASLDVVVSFETVEHVPDPRAFVAECRRVLRPGGKLVMSTPNVAVFNPGRDPGNNPFHCSEMTEREFAELLGGAFARVRYYTQNPVAAGRWSPQSLALEDSPWSATRGYCWLRAKNPTADAAITARAHADPVGAIFARDSRLGEFCNPYLVRRLDRRASTTYLVGVAEVPKS